MQCTRCYRSAVVSQPYSGNNFCEFHFTNDFEKKVKRAIRFHGGLKSGDRIGIALSGGASSAAVALALSKILNGRKDIVLSALSVNPGQQERLKVPREIAETLAIDLIEDLKPLQIKPGSEPETLESRLRELSVQLNLTTFMLGSTLEYCSYEIFLMLTSQDIQGTRDTACQKIITPISSIPKREAILYAELGLERRWRDCADDVDAYCHSPTFQIFKMFCHDHPSAPFALLKVGGALGLEIGVPGRNFSDTALKPYHRLDTPKEAHAD